MESCCMECIYESKDDDEDPCRTCVDNWLDGKGQTEFEPRCLG
jgi:hypothetical protein